ncbi:MAG: NUDIX hydrolase [Deltaproteobacteria bacterium]|nr:NUDIX hydrolase [Deltaproteobacteria bacterium]
MATYKYERPALAVDCVVFGRDEKALKVLLIKRGLPPFKDMWALPGGFVRIDESLDAAARRELKEETGFADVFLEQLYTFGAVDRDPRERVVSVAYYALVNLQGHQPKAASDAAEADWFALDALPKLAFDHKEILRVARERLRAKVRYQPIGFELLPEKFSLSALQRLYETVLDTSLDKRNFRKKLGEMDFVVATGELESGVTHRRAQLFRFDEKKYQALMKRGFNFEL